MPYPGPSPLPDFFLSRKLAGSLPKVGITDGVRPEDLEDPSEAAVDEGLDFPEGGLGWSLLHTVKLSSRWN